MRAEPGSPLPGGPAASIDSLAGTRGEAAVAVIAALDSERECLRAPEGPKSAGIYVLQSGPGPERAAAAARDALSLGAAGLVSWGFAAGLAPALEPGTLVLPAHILGAGGARYAADAAWRGALRDALGGAFVVSEADLLTVSELLATPADKARAARESGAAAADMESAPLAAAARQAGVPFVALRVVLDASADALPPHADRWIDASGNRRRAPVLGALVKPWYWAMLIALAERHRKARTSLIAAADRLLPLGFARSGPSGPAG